MHVNTSGSPELGTTILTRLLESVQEISERTLE